MNLENIDINLKGYAEYLLSNCAVNNYLAHTRHDLKTFIRLGRMLYLINSETSNEDKIRIFNSIKNDITFDNDFNDLKIKLYTFQEYIRETNLKILLK